MNEENKSTNSDKSNVKLQWGKLKKLGSRDKKLKNKNLF